MLAKMQPVSRAGSIVYYVMARACAITAISVISSPALELIVVCPTD
jgi:hypothetical protein